MIFPAVFLILAVAVFGAGWPLAFLGLHAAGLAAEGMWLFTLACCYFWWIRPAVRNRTRYWKIRRGDAPDD